MFSQNQQQPCHRPAVHCLAEMIHSLSELPNMSRRFILICLVLSIWARLGWLIHRASRISDSYLPCQMVGILFFSCLWALCKIIAFVSPPILLKLLFSSVSFINASSLKLPFKFHIANLKNACFPWPLLNVLQVTYLTPLVSCREGVEVLLTDLQVPAEEFSYGRSKIFIRNPRTVQINFKMNTFGVLAFFFFFCLVFAPSFDICLVFD